ncbi:cation/acetate symporter ActP [Pseudomonas sp. S09G 359]|jgi:cation/acetate symporter|uniref:cation/acetate symporter ActP n=1 Tax=Pseudomonas sp. S09G 359 TaxID=2054919 RepID=UPI000C6E0797|nr:cation/acetate symporter ActP [Pseudomonas sp. S09G 359]AUG07741.1 cation acetate symporter [Pseudomonas sp. S09G 359]
MKASSLLFATAVLCLCSFAVLAQTSQAVARQPNMTAIAIFLAFVVTTVGITYWAAGRTRSAADFYTAGGGISGVQNGFAIAGDYMSAAVLLGVSSMVFSTGFDGMIYSVSAILGWPLIMFLMAERLRNLGRYTLADIIAYRLDPVTTRLFSAFSSFVIVCFYLIVQMVGAGQLINLLFGLDYEVAVVCVGVLMVVYVTFGGMVATTWVQIIKAGLLLSGGILLTGLAFQHFGFSMERMIDSAVATHQSGQLILGPLKIATDPVSMISLSLGLVFGIAGLPHIMMRFFTVPDAKAARKSVLVAYGLIGLFFILVCILGTAAISIVGTDPSYFDQGVIGGPLVGGVNMAIMHLAQALGGDLMFGFLAAVAFATILAVVSGLALAGASAISHDLYANVLCKGKPDSGKEMRVSRWATVILGVLAVALGILFKGQNVAFLVALAFGIAASSNFPILLLAMYWKGLTSRGALWGGLSGLVSSLALVLLSPGVWVKVLHHPEALFPYDYPALFSMPLAFAVAWGVSCLDRSPSTTTERDAYEQQSVRAETGWGAEKAAQH